VRASRIPQNLQEGIVKLGWVELHPAYEILRPKLGPTFARQALEALYVADWCVVRSSMINVDLEQPSKPTEETQNDR